MQSISSLVIASFTGYPLSELGFVLRIDLSQVFYFLRLIFARYESFKVYEQTCQSIPANWFLIRLYLLVFVDLILSAELN